MIWVMADDSGLEVDALGGARVFAPRAITGPLPTMMAVPRCFAQWRESRKIVARLAFAPLSYLSSLMARSTLLKVSAKAQSASISVAAEASVLIPCFGLPEIHGILRSYRQKRSTESAIADRQPAGHRLSAIWAHRTLSADWQMSSRTQRRSAITRRASRLGE